MAPPRQARPRVAYDLGRRGEALPDDWHDDPDMAGAYEMGVDDRDAAAAGSNRRHGAPARHTRAREPVHRIVPDTGGKTEDDLASETAGSVASSWRPNLSPKGGGGGLFLGVIGYCLGRAFLTDGPHGMWRWYSAKFMNRVLPGGASSAPATPAQPAPAPMPGATPTPTASSSSGLTSGLSYI